MLNMPAKSPVIFPAEQRRLAALGQRIQLARKRRKLSSTAVALRAGISRTTLYKVEAGDGNVTLGTYLRILSALGLDKDLDALAADDHVGRRLQDLALMPPTKP
jgi:transcriptional regulator with XRE-family HTH domain